MKTDEIILYKRPRANSAPTVIDGQVFCTAEEREELYEICERLSKTGQKIVELTKSAALDYFKIGEWLWKKLEQLPRTTSMKDLMRALPDEIHLSYDTVCRAIKIYRSFADRPELLSDLTLREVMKIITGAKQQEKKASSYITQEDEEAQLEFDAEEFFALPTLSGVQLDNMRFATQDNELYVIRKGFGRAEPIAIFYESVPEDKELQTAYNRMMNNIQREAEKYFATVEAIGASA